MYKLFLIFTILFLTSTIVKHSQSYGANTSNKTVSDKITDTTYDCEVITISGALYSDVNISGLSDSSVKILKKDSVTEIMIKDISSIKFYRRGFWKGAMIGMGTAFAIGLLAGKGIYTTGDGGSNEFKVGNVLLVGIILSVPFGLIGGGIGHLFASDQLYVLSNSSFEEKRKEVRYLIKEYSDK